MINPWLLFSNLQLLLDFVFSLRNTQDTLLKNAITMLYAVLFKHKVYYNAAGVKCKIVQIVLPRQHQTTFQRIGYIINKYSRPLFCTISLHSINMNKKPHRNPTLGRRGGGPGLPLDPPPTPRPPCLLTSLM